MTKKSSFKKAVLGTAELYNRKGIYLVLPAMAAAGFGASQAVDLEPASTAPTQQAALEQTVERQKVSAMLQGIIGARDEAARIGQARVESEISEMTGVEGSAAKAWELQAQYDKRVNAVQDQTRAFEAYATLVSPLSEKALASVIAEFRAASGTIPLPDEIADVQNNARFRDECRVVAMADSDSATLRQKQLEFNLCAIEKSSDNAMLSFLAGLGGAVAALGLMLAAGIGSESFIKNLRNHISREQYEEGLRAVKDTVAKNPQKAKNSRFS